MPVIVVIDLLADKIFFSPIERFLHRRWGRTKNGRAVQPFNRFPIATASAYIEIEGDRTGWVPETCLM